MRFLTCLATLTLAAPHTSLGADNAASADTLLWNWVKLDSAAISAFSPLLAPEQIAATRWVSDSVLTNGFGSADVSSAMNALPGVSMETRGLGGSRRLTVRGSALRSPFAVRNTMLYVRGFLLTEADGNSPIEWLDPTWSGPMSLVSGPAATVFGGAYGGALMVEGLRTQKTLRLQSTLGTTGSGGAQGLLSASFASKGWSLRASRTQNSGYRDWESNEKWQVEVDRAWGSRKAKHYNWLAFMSGSWDLPGSIDSLDLNSNPTFAPGGGDDYKAAVKRNRLLWGHHLHVPNLSANQHRSSLDVWALARWTNKENPFGTSRFFKGYKEESGHGGSLRMRQRWAPWSFAKADFHAEWTLLAVADQGTFGLWESPVDGTQSPQTYDLQVRTSRTHFAPALSWAWKDGWRLEGAVALSARSRSADGIVLDTAYVAPFNTAQILPRLGVSKTLGENLSLFAQTSTGFSDPTNFESLPVENARGMVSVLNAENAWNLELGARHPLGEVVLYDQRVQGPIVERVDSVGASSFANDSSSMRMQGVEARTAHVIGNHRLQASATWQHHRWASGKLPGSPQWMANLQWSWTFWDKAHRFESHLWIRGVGKTFLDNANKNFSPGYALGNFEVTWSPAASSVKATAGMRNLTNTAYSGWNQLNAFGGRYYNPAPPRTGYVTLVWELN